MKKLIIILIMFFAMANLIADNFNKINEPKSAEQLKKQKKLKKILFLNFANAFQNSLNAAIQNKYPCPTNPSQLSNTIQFITLTASTIVNAQTRKLSNTIGRQVRRFTNQHRAANGLGPLAWDQTLANVGRPHTIKMANGTKPFSHDGFDFRFQKYSSQVPGTVRFGENLFYGSGIPTDQVARVAVNAWIASPGHNANLLGNYNRIGVAAFKNSQNVWYLTQLFALVN